MISPEDLNKLILLLNDTEQLVSQFRGGWSDHFLSAEEFHKALKSSIERLKQGELEELNTLFLWFSPSYDWDDFTNGEGLERGNQIFAILYKNVKV